ncbi:MAG: hypothetical protein ACKVP7_07170 [Hyphomicrobiaceae bacterium]
MPEFAVGQRWRFKTRPSETKATFIVGRIEPDGQGGTVVHIAVQDVAIKSPQAPGGVSREIGHSPIAHAALRASATELVASGVAVPDGFEDGYRQWKAAGGGVFTFPLARVIEFIEQVINQ